MVFCTLKNFAVTILKVIDLKRNVSLNKYYQFIQNLSQYTDLLIDELYSKLKLKGNTPVIETDRHGTVKHTKTCT